jgi:hypothetical protein
LNPFEPAFKVHWAKALIALKRTVQACQIVRDLLIVEPANHEALALWHRHWAEQPLPRPETSKGSDVRRHENPDHR